MKSKKEKHPTEIFFFFFNKQQTTNIITNAIGINNPSTLPFHNHPSTNHSQSNLPFPFPLSPPPLEILKTYYLKIDSIIFLKLIKEQ